MIEKEEVINYIKEFEEHTQLLIEKVEKVYDVAVNVCPEEIEDVIMTEYKNSEGERTFENLWFVSEKYMLESKNIMKEEIKIDIACFFHSIDRIEIISNDYDYSEASETSRLNVSGSISNLTFHFRSTGRNSDKLWNIFTTYLKPNIVEYIALETTP